MAFFSSVDRHRRDGGAAHEAPGMMIAAVISELMLFSRIEAAARAAGASLLRLDSPAALPVTNVDLAIVDWSAREPEWAEVLTAWRGRAAGVRLVLFGRHTDLQAHADAREAGLGPMWARSKLVAELPVLIGASSGAEPRHETPPVRGR